MSAPRGRHAETAEGNGSSPAKTEAAPRLGLILIGLMLGLLVAALDQTIVSTALPTIVGDLGGLNHLSWVVTAYLLASTVSTPLWGKLGDLFGRKKLYQASIVIFLIGSVLCGIAQGMFELIAFRAIQGLGGGGLMVLSQAIIGDVVPPRERGRYQGLFGAVFGVTSVAGPLLGGFFVDNLSWRWVFYINVPIGLIALAVIAAALHTKEMHTRPSIDYLGITLLAGGTTCLVLLSTFGGTTYPWASAQIIGLGVAAVLLLAGFVAVERRAQEPVLPLKLFRNRIFSVTAGIGFIVGFAMMGGLSFLPLFMQVVNGATPTESGLRLVPMMGGLLITSIVSGQLISRTGRYKIYPILGTAVMAVGMFLMSRMDEFTTTAASSLYMLVFGVGLGLVMQVIVLAVQNSVPYSDLGVATAGATFFRSIGGSFGAAIFGTIFNNRLTVHLREAAARGEGMPAGTGTGSASAINPEDLNKLPPASKTGFIHAYAESLQTVFLVASGIVLIAFVLSFLLEEVPLREATREAEPTPPMSSTARSSVEEIERAMAQMVHRENGWSRYERMIQRSGVELSVPCAYGLVQLDLLGPISIPDLAHRLHEAQDRVRRYADELTFAGYIERLGEGTMTLTAKGHEALEALVEARRQMLTEVMADWSPEQSEELTALLRKLARLTTDTPHDHIVGEADRHTARARPTSGPTADQ
ncbi:MFS transporter [Embleya sp. NPDC050154]|uniref:MFS transporter n=1 Tax=Embleya sp. NPDC050154 TaxID=3363988 RepID=UPI0037ACAD6B